MAICQEFPKGFAILCIVLLQPRKPVPLLTLPLGDDGTCSPISVGANEERRLVETLFANYDRTVRPVLNGGEALEVSIKLTLTNLISLNEKEETLTTNVWITQQWVDYRLNYSSADFGGIGTIRVPAEMVWLPDIVLENNIDGNFEVAYSANVLIYEGGYMYWLPPAIYRSTCSIEVTFFPFDWQNCSLVFRSQTYSAKEVQLIFGPDDVTGVPVKDIIIDPAAFTENGEWAIRHRPARQLLAPVSGQEAPGFSEMHYFLIIQRKPLFYIINIIIPCVLISSLVVLVYFLPAESGGQKCTVSISVLLAQTVFLFLIAQQVPETSLSVPLIGKYLLFVMVVATIIVTNCVIVLNVSLRSPSTHTMSQRLKHVFLEVLPGLLGLGLEPAEEEDDPWGGPRPRRRSSFKIMLKAEEYILKKPRSEILFERMGARHGIHRGGPGRRVDGLCIPHRSDTLFQEEPKPLKKPLKWHKVDIGALFGGRVVTMGGKPCLLSHDNVSSGTPPPPNMRSLSFPLQEMENWVMIGQVIDKLCFWAAILLFSIGTFAIFYMGLLNTAPDDPFPGMEDPH
nr:acetylcholine receptor subunit epsilon [Anolis sagrei ordinatus]